MEAKTMHSNNISFVEVLAALVEFFTLCALFIIQGTAKDSEDGGQDNENKENGNENEETAAACEPSAFSGILAKAEPAAAKVKAFFAILAKMEWYSFILLGPSLVMLSVVFNCVYILISGACLDMGRAVEDIVLFGLLAFAFAFGAFVMASDEWDDAKKEVLIKSK